ncbi:MULTISPECIES: tRNA-dependent cyclodipeptide synthase [Streptomycetaceae]|uniref:tRNA-dependent cyclodipeptide synthase n=1 Tax=Streptomycetaceae TaxID=2062 RepID=UPI002AFE007E|nr:tRNA-dependent cyclodipeptide synthase [Streptantibioticus cattleyicolor]
MFGGRARGEVGPGVLHRTSFSVEPLTETCRVVVHNRDHVVLGVSPGNSYFRTSLLTELLVWLTEGFRRIDVVIPDTALTHTYEALGYTPQRASVKVRGETNVLRNRVLRAWHDAGGRRPADGHHMMSDLAGHPVYQRVLAQCEAALRVDAGLRRTCRAMSREALLARRPDQEPGPAQIDQGVRYLVEELPFFVASADIFEVGSSLCFYHRRIPLADVVFSGRCALAASPRQGYAVIRPVPEQLPAEP